MFAFVKTGQALVQAGVLTSLQLDECLEVQNMLKASGRSLQIGEIAIDQGYATRKEVEDAIRQTGEQNSGFSSVEVPFEICYEFQMMPIGLQGDALIISPRAPLSETETQRLISLLDNEGIIVSSIVVEPRNAKDVLEYLNNAQTTATQLLKNEIADFWKNQESSDLLGSIVSHVFVEALQQRASDVHIKLSSSDSMCKILYRIDGRLVFRHVMPKECMRRFITAIKLRCNLDASEKNRPQDGRMSLDYHSRKIDLRVSTTPKDDGEVMIVRLLDQSKTSTLEAMLPAQHKVLDGLKALTRIHGKDGGLVLITGPTGMGKSTTMSAMVRAMPRDIYRIVTVEDPVENRIPLVDHTSINEAVGLGFPEMLRAILRQDPDVIVVGEVRDKATAEIALRATETGHLVLSTLHTRSVSETISRMVSMLPEGYRDLGIFAISSNLKAVVNQRLIRKLCSCSERTTVSAVLADTQDPTLEMAVRLMSLGDDMPIKQKLGCPHCDGTGYRGRVLVPEAAFFPSSDDVRRVMYESLNDPTRMNSVLSIPEVLYISREESTRTLVENGILDLDQAVSAMSIYVAKESV